MAAAYNGPPPGRQSADQILLASFAAGEQASAVQSEKLLRERATLLASANRRELPDAARQCLRELAADCECDGAALVELQPSDATLRLHLDAGAIDGVLSASSLAVPLVAAVRSALLMQRPLEHPAMEARDALAPLAALELREHGVLASRWAIRELDGGSIAIVALHASTRSRYWTPATRRLHEGTTDLLVAALARLHKPGRSGAR